MISKYLNEGKFIVVQPNSKHPFVAKGEDWNNRLLDYRDADFETKKGNNIALVCGHGNLIAFDCDSIELYQALKSLLPETYEEKTCSGGYHLIYRCSEQFDFNYKDIKFQNKHIGELRVSRSFILIYPSRAENKYKAGEFNDYELIHDLEPARIVKEQINAVLSEFKTDTEQVSGKIDADILSKINSDAELSKLFNGDCSGFASRSEAEQSLCDKLVARNFDKETIFKIMAQSKTDKWNEKPLSYRNKTYEKAVSFATTEKKGWETLPEIELLSLMTIRDYENYKPDKNFIIKDVIYHNQIGMWYGQSNGFKSIIMLYTGCCISSGKKFLGKFKVKKNPVLIVSAENSKATDKERIKTILRGLSVRKKDIPLYFLTRENCSDILNPSFVLRLFKTIQEKQIKVLFLDTINPLTPETDDNKAKDVTLIFNAFLKPICDRLNCSVIFLHHTDKQGNNYLGSVKWKANADMVLRIERKDLASDVTIYNEKNRSGENNTLKIGIDRQENKTTFKLLEETKPQIFSKKKKITQHEFYLIKLKEFIPDKDTSRADIMKSFTARGIKFTPATLDRALAEWRKS